MIKHKVIVCRHEGECDRQLDLEALNRNLTVRIPCFAGFTIRLAAKGFSVQQRCSASPDKSQRTFKIRCRAKVYVIGVGEEAIVFAGDGPVSNIFSNCEWSERRRPHPILSAASRRWLHKYVVSFSDANEAEVSRYRTKGLSVRFNLFLEIRAAAAAAHAPRMFPKCTPWCIGCHADEITFATDLIDLIQDGVPHHPLGGISGVLGSPDAHH